MRALILTLPLALAACMPQGEEGPSGKEDFANFCAACHGAGGVGDGELAGQITQKPANLTTLAARNGGTFPTTQVMAKIWGAAKGADSHAVMPEFGAMLDSSPVLYDGGDGIPTPTPIRLVQVAEYLQDIQVK